MSQVFDSFLESVVHLGKICVFGSVRFTPDLWMVFESCVGSLNSFRILTRLQAANRYLCGGVFMAAFFNLLILFYFVCFLCFL